MRGAAAQLEAMFQASSWQQSPQHFFDKDSSVSLISSSSSLSLSPSSSSSSSSSSSPSSSSTLPSSTPLLPFSSFFTSSLSLLDDPSLTEALPILMEDALEEDVPSFPEEDQIPLYPPAPLSLLTTSFTATTTSPTTTTLSLPPQESLVTHVPCCSSSSLMPMGVFGLDACSGGSLGICDGPSAAAAAGGGDADGRQRHLDELDKARRRQLKAEQRKERNKEAARRSNLNKKLIRDQLEKKSLELCEENLQLQQDIRDLNEKLRHFRHLHNSMHHVCRRKR